LKYRREKILFQRQTQNAIKEFLEGVKLQEKNDPNDLANNPLYSIMETPYDKSYEIPRTKWKLGSMQNKLFKMVLMWKTIHSGH